MRVAEYIGMTSTGATPDSSRALARFRALTIWLAAEFH